VSPHPSGEPDPVVWDFDAWTAAEAAALTLLQIVTDGVSPTPAVALAVRGFVGRTNERREVQIVFRPGDFEMMMKEYLVMVERSPEWGG
jgi:hypothetical protein